MKNKKEDLLNKEIEARVALIRAQVENTKAATAQINKQTALLK